MEDTQVIIASGCIHHEISALMYYGSHLRSYVATRSSITRSYSIDPLARQGILRSIVFLF